MNSVVLSAKLRSEARHARRRLLYGENGYRIGETHQRAILNDHDVELMLGLRDEGYSLEWLAEKFETSKSNVWSICSGRTRGQAATRTKLEPA
jgi:hypothetical protein